MKKISNNTFLGKLIQILNLVVVVFFILSIVFLLKFDKINVVKVNDEPAYLKAKEELHTIEHPLKQAEAEVDYYTTKLDTLKQHQATLTDKKEIKSMQEDIDRTTNTLSEKKKVLAETEVTIAEARASFEPIETEYNDLVAQDEAAKKTFNIFMLITIICFVAKIVIWAIWNYKNAKNLRETCTWMSEATHPSWAFFGWIIPIYNLIKPYTFYKEVFDETDYALIDKSIVSKESRTSDTDFVLGFWWGTFMITIIVISIILLTTFFGEGPAFYKFNHTAVAIVAIVFWAVYALTEINVVGKYNKMNKMLIDNESKF